MVSGPKVRQSVGRIISETIYAKHAEPGISDRLPDSGKPDSKVQKAVSEQDRNENPQY